MSERNPHLAPAPGDRWRDEITGVVREVCDVRTRSNAPKGPILVYFWMARAWEGKKNYIKDRTGNSVFVGQDTAKIPPRWKRTTRETFRVWTLRPGVKYLGQRPEVPPKPGRATFDMLPAHQAFPEKAPLPANKAAAEKTWAARTAAKARASKLPKPAKEAAKC